MPISRLKRAFSVLIASFFLLIAARTVVFAKQSSYPQALDLAVAAMEEGKQIQALGPMRAALSIDRAEPYGVLALATLYLQSGSYTLASREFSRAHEMLPEEPLAVWGAALSDLAQGKRDPDRFASISATSVPAAPIMAAYVRLLNPLTAGDVRDQMKDVGPGETDPLKLEIAAFAALRTTDVARAETLLTALLARPDMKELSEDRAYLLLFEADHPAEGGAPPLSASIGFPEPVSGFPLNGMASISPPFGMTSGVAMVTYSTEGGGGWTTTTNNPPFTAQWNTSNYPNGPYDVHTVAFDANHRVVLDSHRTFLLQNVGAPLSSALTEQERREMRQRLLVLLTPRASRKAAWYALYEQARLKSDDTVALADLEAVVAIDPRFQNAYTSLHEARAGNGSRPVSWWRGQTNQKLVALTFDDGPNPLPARTPALLDALKLAGVHVTFFVIGARAEQCTDILKRMDADGHEIDDHSFSHPNLTFLDAPAVERELGRTSVIIRQATGKRPHFYRPPGGNFNGIVTDAADALGMAGAFWTLDGLKWENAPFSPSDLTQYVLGNIKPGSIVLLHNAPENTIRAVPAIVAGLRARGYQIVTMSELARRTHPIPIPPGAAAYGYRRQD